MSSAGAGIVPCISASAAGRLFVNYDKSSRSLPDGYYVFAKSIEVWDFGVMDERQNHSTMMRIFDGFDASLYKDPKYDYVDLVTGERRKGEEFKAQSQQSPGPARSAVVGQRAPVELFTSRFGSYLGRRNQCAFALVTESDVASASNLVLLYTPDLAGQVPQFLYGFVPELKAAGADSAMSFVKNSKRVILVKALTEQELVSAVSALPTDIPVRDYSSASKTQQEHQGSAEMDDRMFGVLSRLTAEELDELMRYAGGG